MKRFLSVAVACCLACVLALCVGCASKETYTPEDKTPSVTTPTIGQAGLLRVGVNTNAAPLAGTASGKIVGIDVDIAAALADSLGLKLSIVDVGSDAATALSAGTVDIVMGIDKSTETTFWKSSPYLQTGVVLLSLTSNSTIPTASSGASFAAQVSSKSAWLVMNEYGESALVSTNDLSEALSSLANGSVQYVASDAIIGIYAAHGNDYDVHTVALLQQAGGYCIGVLDTNTALKTTISDAVATLTANGVIDTIESKWLGTTVDLSSVPLTESAQALVNLSATTTTETADAEASADAGADASADATADATADAAANETTGTTAQ